MRLVEIIRDNYTRRGARLDDANFTGARLEGADLSSATLDRAALASSRLASADFTGASGVPTGTWSAVFVATICPAGYPSFVTCWP